MQIAIANKKSLITAIMCNLTFTVKEWNSLCQESDDPAYSFAVDESGIQHRQSRLNRYTG